MRTFHNWKLCQETLEEQRLAGRYNPGLQVHIGKLHLPIGAGICDDVHVFLEEGEYYIFSMNYGLEYVGLQVFSVEGELLDNVFLDTDYQIAEDIGSLELTPMTICKRLQALLAQK